ncbi:MAG TPA: molybdopterin-guanine dinucleotide biosynthesis protein B [Gemmatimonadales bacterium]
MRILQIIGQKDSGKTTLLVALARDFKRKGKRVMTIKHASHPADADRQGTDSWRHFVEGAAERTLIASPEQRILFERSPDDTDPETLARRYFDGADLVLVEGFKRFHLPRIEVHRKGIKAPLLFDPALPNAGDWIAICTDDSTLKSDCRVLRFTDTMWLNVLSALAWEQAKVLS